MYFFFFQAEDGIRDFCLSRGLGDVYKRQDGFRAILQHNFGNIGRNNDNDVRKRVYYTQYGHCTFDVEVKSWVSEIGRANYYKKFGLKHMPERLSPRQMSTMYKLFLHNRSLLKETDAVFEEYINLSLIHI